MSPTRDRARHTCRASAARVVRAHLGSALMVACAAALATAACSRGDGGHTAGPTPGLATQNPAPSGSTLDQLVAQCAEDMIRQTCRIMGNAAGASVPDGSVIVVAGVGAIDAQVYTRLRADGEAMCETVRRSCREAWDGPPCRTARALYGGA